MFYLPYIRSTRVAALGSEVSAISCLPAKSDSFISSQLAVAYWSTNRVDVFYIGRDKEKGLGRLERQDMSEPLPAPVRSVQFVEFDANEKYLICGLADGSFAHFAWDQAIRSLVNKKIVSLGSAPVHLSVCEVDGKKAIFAAGGRSTVIAPDKKKLSHSPVILKVGSFCVSPKDSPPDEPSGFDSNLPCQHGDIS
jgi:DNA damage-binding protein 1